MIVMIISAAFTVTQAAARPGRRVHSENQPATINCKVVKASNPLAPLDEGLYYVHSTRPFFFEFWDG